MLLTEDEEWSGNDVGFVLCSVGKILLFYFSVMCIARLWCVKRMMCDVAAACGVASGESAAS